MGFADGFYYGQGRIVVDITQRQVGDVIRVRSVLDVTKVWNKEITVAGDYMVFDVPSKDIYAICLVQEVDGTPTEVTVKKKSIDYGQTLLTDVEDSDDFIIFDQDNRYAANISEVYEASRYNSSTPTQTHNHTFSNQGKITMYGQSAGYCDAFYLTIDLSKYIGKSLYYKYNVGTGADQVRGFTIGANSKRPIIGVCCYYPSGGSYINRYGMGIASSSEPAIFVSVDNDFYDVIHSQGSAAPNPFICYSKIWISE